MANGMPELPEVETVMRGLAAAFDGRGIVRAEVRRKDLRFPFPRNFARRLEIGASPRKSFFSEFHY